MSRTPAVTLIAVMLVAALAAAFYATRPVPFEAAPATPRVAAAERLPVPAAAPRAARAGRVLSVDEAIKELDLIRPSRPKLAGDFTVPTADGKSFRLSAHRGRPVFVNFWATWCPPCLEEMPAMERLWRAQKGAGLVMLAVAVDADAGVVAPFLKRHELTFPVGLDTKMELANTYGVRALPSSFIIDREGRLAALALGPRAWDNVATHSLVEGLVR
jgi:peroxiredoxin